MSIYHNLSREQQQQQQQHHLQPVAPSAAEETSRTSVRTMSSSHRTEQSSFRMSSVASTSRNSKRGNWNNSGSISMLSYSSREHSCRDVGVPQSPRQESRSSGIFTTFSGTQFYHSADGGAPVPILDVSSGNSQPSSSRVMGGAPSYALHQQPQQQGEQSEFFHQHSVRNTSSMTPRRASERYAPTTISSLDQRLSRTSQSSVKTEPPKARNGSIILSMRGDDSLMYNQRSHPLPSSYSHSGPHPAPTPLPPPGPQTYNNPMHYNNYPRQHAPHFYHQQQHHPLRYSEPRPFRPPHPRDSMREFYEVPSCTIPRDLPPPSPPSPPPHFRSLEPIHVETCVVSQRHRTRNNNTAFSSLCGDVELGVTLDTSTAITAATTKTTRSSGSSTTSSHESGVHSNNNGHKHQVQCCHCQIRLFVSKQAVSVLCPACHSVSAATNVHSFGIGSCLLTRSAAVAAS